VICVFHVRSEPVYICAASVVAALPEPRDEGTTLYIECLESGLTVDERAEDVYRQWWAVLNEVPEIEIELDMEDDEDE
jgi:hypothetical protein